MFHNKKISDKIVEKIAKKQSGFTLVELLVVIAIIGMLSSVVMSSLSSAREKSRIARAIQDMRQIVTALAFYYDTNGSYPNSYGGSGVWDGLYSCWGDSTSNYIPGLTPTYIPSLPRSPNNSTNCDNNYIYRSDGNDYKIIWHNPENCAFVASRYPSLKDPVRDCWAYGFWTPNVATTF